MLVGEQKVASLLGEQKPKKNICIFGFIDEPNWRKKLMALKRLLYHVGHKLDF